MKTQDSIKGKQSINLKALLTIQHLLMTSFLGFIFLFYIGVVHATYTAPYWWNGDNCDSTHHHNESGNTPILLTTWLGIQVCGYGPAQASWPDVSVNFPGVDQFEWECAELVKRFLYVAHDVDAISAHGANIVEEYVAEYPGKFRAITNDGNTHVFPKAGDILSYSGGTFGHTALVTDINITDASAGDATLTLVEQNADLSGTTTQLVDNWVIQGDVDDPTAAGDDTVTAWLNPLTWNDDSPTTTSPTAFYAIDASSLSNIWTVGHEMPSGNTRKPVAYKSSGSGWTRYAPSPVNSTGHHELHGLTVVNSTDVWAVGQYTANGIKTLAYRWNGTSWSQKTTVNPGGTMANYLFGVDNDGTGNIFAVGYYAQPNQITLPLIQKSTGGNFTAQSAQLPSGVTSAQLSSVAMSSATNGWAVGNGYSGGTFYDLVYTYNGTTWTGSLGSVFRGNLKSVVALSDTEAWAVGMQGASNNIPLIMHYTSGGGWQEDSSFTFPTGTVLHSISADATNDVWVVGHISGSPLILHYNGTNWVQVATPGGTGQLKGVVANSYQAWSSGYAGSYSSNPVSLMFKH